MRKNAVWCRVSRSWASSWCWVGWGPTSSSRPFSSRPAARAPRRTGRPGGALVRDRRHRGAGAAQGSSWSIRTRRACCSSSAATPAPSSEPGPALDQPVLQQAAASRCACATSRAAKIKVNDIDGNPIEIAAVVVWQVVDTAEAVFDVDDYENFVHIQASRRCADLATHLPLRRPRRQKMSLRGHAEAVAELLRKEIQDTAGARPASR